MGKPNKYQKVEVPEPRVLIPHPGINRKDRRKVLFDECPCGSGKKFKNCHLEEELSRRIVSQRD